MPGVRSALAKVLDYFVFCCSRGLRFGLLEETYNVILINIRREVIENRCIISVTNPYRRPEMQPLFAAQVLEPIQEELKSLSKMEMGPVGESAANPYLNESSPTQLEIHIHKKIYNLFILPEIKDFNRYKNIFLHSQEKISTEMQRHRARLALPAPPTKKGLPSPAQLIELFNAETAALMNCIRNSYKEEEHPETSYLHSLVTSEIAQEIAFYTIEETLCLHELPALKEIYYLHTAEQCEAYNKQMDFLNANCTDAECFDHL